MDIELFYVTMSNDHKLSVGRELQREKEEEEEEESSILSFPFYTYISMVLIRFLTDSKDGYILATRLLPLERMMDIELMLLCLKTINFLSGLFCCLPLRTFRCIHSCLFI